MPSYGNDFPEIDPKKNDFKDVFPEIDKFINGAFVAKNLKVDPLSKYILELEYKGEMVGVENSKRNATKSLMKFLNTHLLEKGVGIYRYRSLASWATDYVYLTDEQAEEFKQIFEFRYHKVE